MKRLAFFCLLFLSLNPGYATVASKKADCSVARDPRRCEAQQAAREACSGLQGQAHSACMHEAMPPPDCSRAPNTIQCQARQAAATACKDKHGKAHRQCLREQATNP